MKTVRDLLILIADKLEANEGKALKYTFMIDTSFDWVSMSYTLLGADGIEKGENILKMAKINTPERLQMVYWTIAVNGRTMNE